MRSLVIYESMYGNTHQVADAIGRGLEGAGPVDVVPVGGATPELVAAADLLVVGGPTHAHAMSRESSRDAAVNDAADPDSKLTLDPDAEGEGLREWFDDMPPTRAAGAAYDTRFDLAAVLTGRASKGIAKRLRRHGVELVVEPESFLVERGNVIVDGELVRAEAWGRELATRVARTEPTATFR